MDVNKPTIETLDRTTSTYRTFRSTMLILPFFAMGTTLSMQSTVLVDLRTRLNATTQEISYALGIGQLGPIVGGPLSALADRWHSSADVQVGLMMLMTGLSYGLMPYSSTWVVLGVLDFFFSIGNAFNQAACHSIVSGMWGNGGSNVRHAMHLGFTIGAVVGPLIAIPFLGDSSDSTRNDSGNSMYGVFQTDFNDGSSIEYGYLIQAAMITCFGVVFFILQYLTLKTNIINKTFGQEITQTMTSAKAVLKPESWADGDRKFGIVFLALLMTFCSVSIASWVGFSYMNAYAVDSGLGFDSTEAALMQSVSSLVSTFARVLTTIFSDAIDATLLLYICCHGSIASTFLATIFGTRSKIGLWITYPLHSFFMSPIWPQTFVWANAYIIVFAIIVGLCDLLSQTVSAGVQPLTGFLYENVTIDSIFYLTIGFEVLMIINLYIMHAYSRHHGTHYDSQETKNLESQIVVVGSLSSYITETNDTSFSTGSHL